MPDIKPSAWFIDTIAGKRFTDSENEAKSWEELDADFTIGRLYSEAEIMDLKLDFSALRIALQTYENAENWGLNGIFDANSGNFCGTSFAHQILAVLEKRRP